MDNMSKPNHKVWTEILKDQISPLRILFFLFLPGMVVPQLHIPADSAMMMMNYLPVFAAAAIGLIAFEKREKLKTMPKLHALHYVSTLSIGVFTIEFVHVLGAIFYEAGTMTPELKFWLWATTIYTGFGSILLVIIYFYSEKIDRYIFSKINPKLAMLSVGVFAISTAVYSLWINPQFHEFFSFLASLI